MRSGMRLALLFAVPLLSATSASATPYFFSTGNPDGMMGMASRPDSTGRFEIESADDFVLTQETSLTSASFTGLLTGSATVGAVRVEIYRVFPFDSDTVRTPNVPTRVNSPSDVAFAERDSSVAGMLSFSTTLLAPTFTTANSIQPGGIHPSPNQTTGGNGAITGQEVRFDLTFSTALDLLAGHYFFVPQVEMVDASGEFYWLSAPRPIGGPGTPFPPGFTDLQTWTRDAFIDPDWLKVGTDIVGGGTPPTFNAALSLTGDVVTSSVPEPGSLALIGLGGLALMLGTRRKVSGFLA